MLCKYILRQQKRSRCRKCVSLIANNKILNLHLQKCTILPTILFELALRLENLWYSRAVDSTLLNSVASINYWYFQINNMNSLYVNSVFYFNMLYIYIYQGVIYSVLFFLNICIHQHFSLLNILQFNFMLY